MLCASFEYMQSESKNYDQNRWLLMGNFMQTERNTFLPPNDYGYTTTTTTMTTSKYIII